jgi:hypothetical protein
MRAGSRRPGTKARARAQFELGTLRDMKFAFCHGQLEVRQQVQAVVARIHQRQRQQLAAGVPHRRNIDRRRGDVRRQRGHKTL